ncbi:TRADD-N-associated membrane domain-containing protein [Microbispora triticiradicis]|uniref:Cyanobacterial TRADD-N associated 2 transmembrane domain-containing protein n=2 Tax=Microbispora TaxID=2005 RepID=A0ABY3LVM7_9ACTN|nr:MULTISPECIES: hypothetical protein [Microbispora]TLP52413.1 hypothetical protein FED44_32420 [Microbispora fusca]TYB55420.1 hypothetical protein FXF59_21185 [Microbispora tritici]
MDVDSDQSEALGRWYLEPWLRALLAALSTLTTLAIALPLIDLFHYGAKIKEVQLYLLIPVGLLPVILAIEWMVQREVKNRRLDAAQKRLRAAEGALKKEQELALGPLWVETEARLDYYHEIATNHARQSFRSAQVAMVAGFVVVLLFAVLAIFFAKNPADRLLAGTLGLISAALSGFISRTFIRAQEAAANRLQAYFDHPVRFSRYLAAERLIEQMKKLNPEEHKAIEGEFLNAVVAPYAVLSGESLTNGLKVPPEQVSVPDAHGRANFLRGLFTHRRG